MLLTIPIKENGRTDYDGLARLTNFYIDNGMKIVIAVGSTGYCYALTEEEYRRAADTIYKRSNK